MAKASLDFEAFEKKCHERIKEFSSKMPEFEIDEVDYTLGANDVLQWLKEELSK